MMINEWIAFNLAYPKTAKTRNSKRRVTYSSSQCRVHGPSQNSCKTEQKDRSSVHCGKLAEMATPVLTPADCSRQMRQLARRHGRSPTVACMVRGATMLQSPTCTEVWDMLQIWRQVAGCRLQSHDGSDTPVYTADFSISLHMWNCCKTLIKRSHYCHTGLTS